MGIKYTGFLHSNDLYWIPVLLDGNQIYLVLASKTNFHNTNSNRECVVIIFSCMLYTCFLIYVISVAVIGGFQGNEYITYYYTTTQETHTNDISLRFKSFLRNAFLFQTVSSSSTDYLRGELDNGRIKVTIKVEGQPPQVNLC